MLDIKFIRENKDLVKKNCEERNAKCDIDQLLALDEQRKDLLRQTEELNAEKNRLNAAIQKADAKEKKKLIGKGRDIKEKLEKALPLLEKINAEFKKSLFRAPNIHSDDTPVGRDETGNMVIKKVGELPKFDFQPKEHWQLGEELGVIDIKRAAKVSGSRFNYLKNELAFLEFALIQHAFAVLTDENILKEIAKNNNLDIDPKPFIPIVPPVLIKQEVLEKMSRLEPKEERYHIPLDNMYLIGSAEHSVGAMHMDEIFNEKDLPLRYIAFSPSFRREAGSYGKDMKGILRVHQFDKLEMVSFTIPEKGLGEQNFILAVQEHLANSLRLPFQVVSICTGDMGAPDFRQIDIETWMPGQNQYRETHTSDYNTDYQSRRLNTKVQRKNGKPELVHMNDATAFAIGRTIMAIMENFQQADGSVKIPNVLRKYMPGEISEIRPK